MNNNHKRPRIKILVACHKADPNIRQDDIYMPIQVGKALHPELNLGFQCDNTGDNISEKNGSYCELTALYWAWKNLKDVDYIGLCHYRRYFDFSKKGEVNVYQNINQLDFHHDNNKIIDSLRKCKIIVPTDSILPTSLFAHYSYFHNSEDMREVERIIDSKYPDYADSFRYVMYHNNKFHQYNMFVTSWEIFDKLCNWLFGILSQLEQVLHIEYYNPIQRRIYGYISERLLNVFIYHNNLPIINCPIAFISDLNISPTRMKLAHLRDNLIFKVSKK